MSTAHRGRYGDGAIFREGGRWVGRIEAGIGANGKRRRRKFTGPTQGEVRAKMAKARADIAAGITVGGAMTLNVWLDHWMANVVPAGAKKSPNTIENYEWALSHIRPALGHLRLRDLTTEHVERLLRARADAGMARSSVGRIRMVLTAALQHAEARGHVVRNAAALAVIPETRPTVGRRSLTLDESKALLAAAKGERLEALFATALATALRPGELYGLTWDNLNLDAATLTVSKSMKDDNGEHHLGPTKRATSSMRTVGVPPWLVTALRAHRARQRAERLALGAAWSSEWDLVFCSTVGTPLDGPDVRRVLRRIARRAGLAPLTIYELRHTTASLLIDAGESVEHVADVMGDNPLTLYSHYRHKVRAVADAAAGPMQAMFGGVG